MEKLTLLTLPIGNLKDISVRAKEALSTGENFIAEDTRMLAKLMKHYEIDSKEKNIFSFHEHTNIDDFEILFGKIKGEAYLVSDAGSPVVSDPAYPLVKLAIDKKVTVDSFPGPSAVIMGLELSGLAPLPFHFLGFFPRESDKKNDLIELLPKLKGSTIFFESPHRIIPTLELLCKNFPHAHFSVGRELTKLYQSVYRFEGADFDPKRDEMVLKGEFMFVISFPKEALRDRRQEKSGPFVELAQTVLEDGGRPKALSKLLAQILGDSAKDLYKQLVDNRS